MANSLTTELVRMDLAGEDFRARAAEYDAFYLRFFDVACEVYRKSAPVYGSPRALAAKIYWDDFNYWSFVCQYFFKKAWKLPPAEHARFVEIAGEFAALQFKAQTLLAEWAKRAKDEAKPVEIQLPPIPSLLANLHLELTKEMTTEELHAYMSEKRALTEELLGEIVLRALGALGPVEGMELARAAGLAEWDLKIDPARFAAESAEGGARRRSLSLVARDLERCVGRADRHPDVVSLEALVEAAFARPIASPPATTPGTSATGAAG